ncbi:methyltransferase domain-containing protein [archaeon]|nr:methyltransferase domain-containing protein [archaeon]
MIEYYDKLSQGYDELYGAEQREKYEFLKDWLSSLKGSILDVGSGTGIINEFIKPDVLTDSSLGMLSRAEGTRVVCDARFLPFKDKSFDNITCFTVLQDIIDKKRVVKELERVCSDKLIITILKKLKSREELELLFNDFKIADFKEQAKDYCFLLKVLK